MAELAASLARDDKPALKGDAIAGVVFAEAASRAAAQLVEVNLAQRTGDRRLEEVAELARRARAAREQALGSG